MTYYEDPTVTLHHGNCLDILATLPDASVDSIITDPPYGLANTDPAHVAETITRWVNGERDYLPGGRGFMGKEWDAFVPPVAVWDECLRVLKPGGHVLAFAGSRTVDLMTLGLRLAGFDIRDSVAWLYGSGFPKSLDVSKAIDKAAGAQRAVVGQYASPEGTTGLNSRNDDYGFGVGDMARRLITAPATPDAQKWQGFGTALKPAFEPVVMARKPLAGTVAANVLQHGTGALNVDGCRIGTADDLNGGAYSGSERHDGKGSWRYRPGGAGEYVAPAGRWPANVILDESQARELDLMSGERPGFSGGGATPGEVKNEVYGNGWQRNAEPSFYGDTGGASRFMYVAKADASERVKVDGIAHPTVKPLAVMRWLTRLVTPPGGTVLEPFAGSGTTVEACILEGFKCIAVEREADYLPLIVQRINRRRDPVEAVRGAGEDGGLFDLLDGGAA